MTLVTLPGTMIFVIHRPIQEALNITVSHPFGGEVVREMNRLGMMIDVSHISDKAFYDVLKLTKAPVIASHSSCRALCGSPRNLDDDMLLALKENGGVIQICILSEYIKTPDPNPELEAKLKELQEKVW
ncbi:MAG: dipeptidase [Sphingobacterium sp.]|nr:dipeptidase [Sphingobacterium sp.]